MKVLAPPIRGDEERRAGGSERDAPSPLVSVVVPMFNAGPYLRRCLDALLQQSMPREAYEIILVDNNSTDDSLGIARRHAGVRVLRQPRQSSYAARNLGIEESRGSIVALIDSDCVAAPDWLERLGNALHRSGTALVMGQLRAVPGAFFARIVADYETAKAQYVLSADDASLYFGYAGNMALRRDVFDSVGPFSMVDRGGDSLFVQKVVKELGAGAVEFCPDALVDHLELNGARSYMRKMHTYGLHRETNNRLHAGIRPLSQRERFSVMTRTMRDNRYSPAQAVALLPTLLGGYLGWQTGIWRSRRQGLRAAAGLYGPGTASDGGS